MKTLRIVIDGRMINESGIGRYIRNLIAQLQLIDQVNEYYILHLKDYYDTLVYHNNFHKVLVDFSWYGISEQVKLPGLLKSLKPDLVHFPHFNMPIFYGSKFVVTIHDLIHQHFSMGRATMLDPITYKIKRLGYTMVFRNAVLRSSKILVPSTCVKDLLTAEWDATCDKVIVTPEAVDDKIFTIVNKMSRSRINQVMKKFNVESPYIFYVGNAHPHKNVEGLIRVFKKLKLKHPDLLLVLSGNDHYFWQRIRREFQEEGILYTGYVIDEELVALYKNAEMFVMPSLEEGFGIPILEAFACSCPVVSSNAGSLPEVGGNACLYFDPENRNDMIEKISKVLDDKSLRQQLVEKGLTRYKQFSWQKLAKKTLEVYESCG